MTNKRLVVGLVGNPNCGKTTVFNALTGAQQKVGNWPGVTVERKIGRFHYQNTKVEVVDLPGTYSLDYFADNTSLDEQITQNYVISREADLIINIVDASNLERNLYLSTQLLEMRVPMIIVLNMMDMATEHGMNIDIEALQKKLNCTVIPLVASKKQGIDNLKDFLSITDTFTTPNIYPSYPSELQKAATELKALLPAQTTDKVNSDWLALKLLEGDNLAKQFVDSALSEKSDKLRDTLETTLEEEIDIIAADARYTFISNIISQSLTRKDRLSRTLSDKIDNIVLNRALGIPIFLLVMYIVFMLAINLGGAFPDFFDGIFGTIFVDGVGHLITSLGGPEWLKVVLADGIGGGIQTVSTFIPVIAFLFLFLSILEDSGYMVRAAFVMDRFMRFIGLPGKSFVPLIVGFGCNVPAVMATRTLESERDRLMTMAMSPFMSCGARLPIYALFAVAFFPSGGQNIVFLLYLIGIGAAILTGLVLKNTLLPGKAIPFVMELPPYHIPSIKGIGIHIWGRLKSFIFRAGKVIVPMVMVLNILNTMGTDGSFGHEDTEQSVLASIGKTIVPAFKPMGLTDENWPAAVGIFTGVIAKEAVVGTLKALYQAQVETDETEKGEEEEGFNFWGGIKDAFATIPENIKDLSNKITDPLGMELDTSEADEIPDNVFGVMRNLFPNTAAAFAYLLLILLYFPCVAVIGAVNREASLKWAVFIGVWTTAFGYSAAVIFYQIAMFTVAPLNSTLWIGGLAVFIIASLFAMRKYAANRIQTFQANQFAGESA